MGRLTSIAVRQLGNLGTRTPKLTERFANSCASLAWYLRLRLWCAEHPCPASPGRAELYPALVAAQGLDGPLDYLEFGTASGTSLRAWLDLNSDPGSRFFAFDTFEGLPEPFRGLKQGAFSTRGALPQVSDQRCDFVKGLFQDTLPPFLAGYRPGPRRLIHIDADLYTSTLFVLFSVASRLRPGDVLLFDELGIWEHEFRALLNFQEAIALPLRPVARTDNWRQVAFVVEPAAVLPQ